MNLRNKGEKLYNLLKIEFDEISTIKWKSLSKEEMEDISLSW